MLYLGFLSLNVHFSNKYMYNSSKNKSKQVAFQSNANHPLAESMGYIKFEGM